ncbi:hypothetical protein HY78_08655 [Rhizorhabdus wittichii DC-6]|nr:hypothetical protein HY78_08655 [Rhizorhabdus wittichii DC-6]
MARSRALPVRRAMLVHMKGDAPLVALVPAASIFGQIVPANTSWPYIRMGSPSAIGAVRGTCMNGAEGIVSIHGFSIGRRRGEKLVETAEDHAGRIGDAIAAALDGARLPLDGGGKVKLTWTGDQLLQDPEEAGAFHTVQNFTWRFLS